MLGKFFPIKTKNLEEFIKLLKEKKCKHVKAETIMTDGSDIVSGIGEFVYYVKLTSSTPRGRKVVYREKCKIRFGSACGFADAKERGKTSIRLLLTAGARLETIKKEVTIETKMPIDGEILKKLHEESKELGVTSFDL